jgi:uncharacterized membrane protein
MTAWLFGGPLGAGGAIEWTAPDWQIVAAAVAALLAWVVAWIGRRPLGASLLESATWGLALFALVVAFAGPVWVLEEGRMEPGRVAVLVDASRSMSVLEEGTPRSDAVRGVLAEVARQVGSPDVYHFGDELAVGAPDHFDLPGTDLEQALDALSERVAGERLAGVVVISDGLDRGLLRKRFEKEEGALPPDAPGPLTVVQAGALDQVVDLSVHDVDAGGYAFIRAPFSVRAEVWGLGFADRTVPVTLTRDGAPVTERRLTLDAEGRGEVTFDVVPEDAGRFAYAVQVPVYEGDAVPANNTLPVVVKVVRDRIRVLQVAGAPSWDVKFLRRFLEGDPSVQLVSFFILRTQRDLATSYTERELSLIQFPYERLFEEDLWTFDVVIFQNFDAENYFDPYQSGTLLGNVRDYVENGGAFVMIGGDRSFGLGHYGATPLAELLPVELSRTGEQPDTAPFLPTLTAEGERHPITRLVSEAGENGEWWERLHPLDGTNVVLRAKPDAAVLLAHPTRKDADGRPLPILAVQEVGAGRSMALTVDASWRWSLSEAAQGRGNQAYLRFWKNAVRWLMRDATVSRVSVDTPRENYALGQDVRIVVRARDPGFGPIPGATVRVTVDNEGRVTELEGRTTPDGDLVLSAPAERVGTHRVRAEVSHDGRTVGTADTVFAVTSRDPELDEVAPDARFLQWLASSTGGRYVGPGEDVQVLVDPDAARRVDERHETPLWRAPLLGAFVLACAGIAWIVRRSSGLR